METRTDILSDEDIENVKASIEFIIFQYVGLLPDSVIIQNIDETLIDYSAGNKEEILKDVSFYQSKIKERDILEYISDDFYKKHVDKIEYQVQHFDYDNIDLYYDASSKDKLPLYQLLEEQQYHQTLNIAFKTAQSEYKKQLQIISNKYKETIYSIFTKRVKEINFVIQQHIIDSDSIYEKYEKEDRGNLNQSDETNRAFEKNKKELNAIFEQYDKALQPIFEQSKKGCGSFVKPREKELEPVTALKENRIKLESGYQLENKDQFEESNQLFDSILENINGFLQKEATSGMTYSGTWASETCIFKGGVKTCRETSGQF